MYRFMLGLPSELDPTTGQAIASSNSTWRAKFQNIWSKSNSNPSSDKKKAFRDHLVKLIKTCVWGDVMSAPSNWEELIAHYAARTNVAGWRTKYSEPI